MKLADRIFRRSRGNGKDQYYVTSPFGWRKDPISGEYKGHTGCDYGTHGNKWEQYALEEGVVESTYKDYYGALCVRISYPRLGIRLTHAHLDCIKVKKGQAVNKDTIIGNTGTTGYSTGVHLHLGVQPIGSSNWIDPETIDYEEAKPIPTPTYKFKIGEKVVLNGQLYASSTGNKKGKVVNGVVTNITRIAEGAKHPYNTTGDLGWMDEDSIMLYNEPEPAALKKGDVVIITGTGNGSSNGNSNTAYGIGWERTIMNIYEGRPYPYQVGKNGITTGFYKASSLRRK